jgi:hypothetical protein
MEKLSKLEKVPKLVNPENFKNPLPKVEVPEIVQKVQKVTNAKWNLNKILLIGFLIFMLFFLYNCKYGMFKCVSSEPIPYSLVYNNSI